VGSTNLKTLERRLNPNAGTNACAAATHAVTTSGHSHQVAHEHYINRIAPRLQVLPFSSGGFDGRGLVRI
jgi:hypothetical protein